MLLLQANEGVGHVQQSDRDKNKNNAVQTENPSFTFVNVL